MDVKEPSEVEFGEGRLNLTGAHLVDGVMEALYLLKIEQRLGEVEKADVFRSPSYPGV